MRVLIVDDSVVFRSQIKSALSDIKEVEVVGSAANGKIALAKLEQVPIDLMTLDVEMPEMNGIETLKELRKRGHKCRVIMFSSLTAKGGTVALEALRYGADDVIGKPAGDNLSLETAGLAIAKELIPKVTQFIESAPLSGEPLISKPMPAVVGGTDWVKKDLKYFKPKLIVIGSSTGGPRALEEIFSKIKGPIRIPILIVQHMPPVFTKCLANRIQELTGIESVEASQMEVMQANKVYVAPGDYHMRLHNHGSQIQLKLDQGPQQNMVRPAVDPLFESAAEIFGDQCMAFVLTGMGEDGCRGAVALKRSGGGVMIQDKESCIVFGMPGAVYRANAYDQIGTLSEISRCLGEMVRV